MTTAKTKPVKGKHGGARKGAGAIKGVPLGDRHRARIRVGVLLARAEKIATGALAIEDPQVESVRQRYLQLLLNKSLPDLTRTELTGEGGGPLEVVTRAE